MHFCEWILPRFVHSEHFHSPRQLLDAGLKHRHSHKWVKHKIEEHRCVLLQSSVIDQWTLQQNHQSKLKLKTNQATGQSMDRIFPHLQIFSFLIGSWNGSSWVAETHTFLGVVSQTQTWVCWHPPHVCNGEATQRWIRRLLVKYHTQNLISTLQRAELTFTLSH